jgi:hypothetical protein
MEDEIINCIVILYIDDHNDNYDHDVLARPRNFPPLPKFCPCQPCFYINIGEEIPPSERWKMRLLIALLFFYAFLLFINPLIYH